MGPQSEIKIALFFKVNDIWGRVFLKVVILKYTGMININVGEMCFIPMNVHNELFNGVRQLRWQHLSSVVSTFSTSIWLILLFHKALHPPSLFPSLSVHLSLFLSVIPHPVCLISGISLWFGDVDFSSSCNPKFFAVRNIVTTNAFSVPVLESSVMGGPEKNRSRGQWSHIVS